MVDNISLQVLISSGQFEKEKRYWMEQLSGINTVSSFPFDRIDMHEPVPSRNRGSISSLFFPDELFKRLQDMSHNSMQGIFIVMAAGIACLLYRYTGNKDIVLRTPVFKQDVQGSYINDTLALRSNLDGDMTFKELLIQFKETVSNAGAHMNYPFVELEKSLDLHSGERIDHMSVFNTMVVFENIHEVTGNEELACDAVFFFFIDADRLGCNIAYNMHRYLEQTVESWWYHLGNFLSGVLAEPGIRLADTDILSEHEKRQLLDVFNDSESEYPKDGTVLHMFENQAEKAPAVTALVSGGSHISYYELNRLADRWAGRLRQQGVHTGAVVGIMAESSIELIAAILGISKAGGAYMPIDPGYPGSRIKFMLRDSDTRVLITRQHVIDDKPGIAVNDALKTVLLYNREEDCPGEEETGYPGILPGLADLHYVIYTSGSTGKPKGVMVNHGSVLNLVYFHQKAFGYDPGSRFSQVSGIGFDAMVFELWPALAWGATLYIAGHDTRTDPENMQNWLIRNKISLSFQPTTMGELLLNLPWPETGVALKLLKLGGDELRFYPARSYPFRIYNLYGPTEDTVWTTWTEVALNPGVWEKPPIGTPVGNKKVYIVGPDLFLQPIGVPGELCIGGAGLARGYLNRPELTAEKFVSSPFTHLPSLIYKTGDLARWQADGNIRYLGRIDRQVKIRGFRIELEEIEHLLTHNAQVKQAVVEIAETTTPSPDKYLCAYVVLHRQANGDKRLFVVEKLRHYLAEFLPDYMVPSFIVPLDKFPLTPNGKIDSRVLKRLAFTNQEAEEEYIKPANAEEEILVKMWADVLGIKKDRISRTSDFFRLGGHSLKAAVLASRIHRELNTAISISDVFNTPMLMELALLLKKSSKDHFAFIEPVEKKEYYRLSSAQKRLFLLSYMEANTAYNLTGVWNVTGRFQKEHFNEVLCRLIHRHESLRTSFRLLEGVPVQVVHDTETFEAGFHALDQHSQLEQEIRAFIEPFDLEKAPLMRFSVLSLDRDNHFLMFDIHHIVSDGVSMAILIEEFANLYQGNELAGLRLQYKDYSEWQNKQLAGREIEKQEEYWLNAFNTGIPVLNIPRDFPRPEKQNFEGQSLRFEISPPVTAKLKQAAVEKSGTLFIVLLAAFNVLLSRYTEQEDIVVGTPVAGRNHADLENIIGMFVNTILLRNRPEAGKPFSIFLEEVRENAISAFDNEDYPFESLVGKLGGHQEPGRNPLFDVLFVMENMDIPTIEMKELRFVLHRFENKISHLDLVVYTMETGNKVSVVMEYATSLFKKETIELMGRHYREILAQVADNKEIELRDIKISHDLMAARSRILSNRQGLGAFQFE
jgi:amino acid adenylation domain-containing protein